MIVETEAYRAPDDQACHAWKNRRTARTETMFATGGIAYVYLCYGIHHLFNIVTAEKDMAHVVLIRAVEPMEGQEVMFDRRGIKQLRPQLTAGPGVMTKALGINIQYNGTDLTAANSPIWVEDRGVAILPAAISESPRVGVAYAGAAAEWPWRFWLRESKWVSKWKK